jgi:hypothetical protein
VDVKLGADKVDKFGLKREKRWVKAVQGRMTEAG